ncbi:MAG: biotin-(acetyl-CoA carboxylase) ligase [Desulforhopalus sp.]|jgi:biotin-(acetyl-CoA carboxylase) ligase
MSQLRILNQASTTTLAATNFVRGYPTLGELIIDKLPAFLYLLAENYTIQYANDYFTRQFGNTDPLTTCYSVMRGRTSPCNSCPAQTVFKDRKKQVWTWRDKLRGQLYEVHDYPFPLENGNMLVLGLGINIQEKQKAPKAIKKNQSRHEILSICSHCKDINKEKGEWEHIENYLKKTNDMCFSHGVCPECLVKHYPDVAKEIQK